MAVSRLDRATRAARRAASAFTDTDDVEVTLVSDASNFLFRCVVGASSEEPPLFALRVGGEQSTRTPAQVECEVSLLLALHARGVEEEASAAGADGQDTLRSELCTPVPLKAMDGRRVVTVRDGEDDSEGEGGRGGSVRLCVAFG